VTRETTDATFATDVIARSADLPVVVDLWAPWCGPCRTLGPILETVVDETAGTVELVRINVDENPQAAATFQVQSIPAVYALRDGKVVDGFIGAAGEAAVREFVARLSPKPSEADRLAEAGDEVSLRAALELQPDHPGAVVALAELLIARGGSDEALALLGRIPESERTRRVAAAARLAQAGTGPAPEPLETRLDGLLSRVKSDADARREYLDLLETMDPADPRRDRYRRALASQLF
jgi:putative thioredoxin